MTTGGSIQNFAIPNIENVDNDPIFSVDGDIAVNWLYGQDNGVRIALTKGHFSAEENFDHNIDGLGIDLGLRKDKIEGEKYKIEVSNIQNCSGSPCGPSQQKIQGKDHGDYYESGVVYGNYAIYVSNSTTKFPYDQKLNLVMKSKKFSYKIADSFS